MSTTSATIAICIITYIAFGAFLYLVQTNAIFQPDNTNFNACSTFKDSQKVVHNGTRMYYTNHSDTLVIVFHGNAGAACDRSALKSILDNNDVSTLFVEYTGYSGDTQKPSSAAILKNADDAAAFAKSLAPKKIIILSESIGSGPATYLAKENPHKIILMTPFSRLSDLTQSKYPIYPTKLLLKHSFDNIHALQNYTGALVSIHGTNDTIIPIKFSNRLLDAANTVSAKKLYTIEGAGHNNLLHYQQTINALNEELKG
ncbi:MAG TPA: alpha/beta hydrolase [Acidobacteriota bacterium]|nr:alpha/beta hydrolase [Acidobacteriota bacterium]